MLKFIKQFFTKKPQPKLQSHNEIRTQKEPPGGKPLVIHGIESNSTDIINKIDKELDKLDTHDYNYIFYTNIKGNLITSEVENYFINKGYKTLREHYSLSIGTVDSFKEQSKWMGPIILGFMHDDVDN